MARWLLYSKPMRLLRCLLILLVWSVSCTDFDELFQSDWSPDHILIEQDHANLTLDSVSGINKDHASKVSLEIFKFLVCCAFFQFFLFVLGCGFESKKKYLFGKASVQIKLVEGDSAGTVTAFYVMHTHLVSKLQTSLQR